MKADGRTVTFRVKDYRVDGHARYTTMTLDVAEFIRRFLLHILPKGFHRIRHYGLLATGTRAENIERARKLLDTAVPYSDTSGNTDFGDGDGADLPPCPCCGSRLRIVERFQRGETPTHRPSPLQLVFRFDTS